MMAGAAAALAPTALRQVKALQQADPDVRGPLTWVPLPVPLMAKLTKSGILSAERALADGIDNRTQSVPAAEGRPAVRLELYRRQGLTGAVPALLWIHGGGYVMGAVTNDDDWCCRVAAELDVQVVSTDYRKAPEHPFPAAPDDCWAALQWAAAHAGELGGDPARLAVAGDSAGANLACALALRARDEGGPALRAQINFYGSCNYPWPKTPSAEEFADGPLLTSDDVDWFWEQYLTDPATQQDDPLASPLRAASHEGLAPAFVATAECDPSRDDAEAFAVKLEHAGVTVARKRYPGMIHGFASWVGFLPGAREALQDAVRFLKQHTGK